jgi:lysophospholipase L1-like esterase
MDDTTAARADPYAIVGADVVSVTIGFNDADNSSATAIPTITKTFEENLEGILDRIQELRAGKRTAIRVTNLYNNGGPGWAALVEAVNAVTCRVAERHDAICVDVYKAFNGPDGTTDPLALHYLGPDGVHPSQAGMNVIADALAAAGYEPLR